MKIRPFLGSMLMTVLLLVSAGSDLAESAPWGPASTLPWIAEEVDSGGQVGTYVSVAIDPESGATYISYFDTANDDLRVARYVGSGGNCGPANAWTCEVVDASVQGGQYSSIAVDPSTGLPSVAYHEATEGALKYAAYACDGSCGWVVHTIDPKIDSYVNGQYASLAYYLDAPHIAYTRSGIPGDSLWLAHYTGANGNCGPNGDTWWCYEIDTPADIVQYTSLSTAGGDGPLRIAYYAAGTGLQLATLVSEGNGNCGPDDSWLCAWIDLGAEAGRYASLAASPTAEPHIAYYDGANGELRLAIYVQWGGNCGPDGDWQCDTIDSMGTSIEPMGLSIALDHSDLPIIAYQDASEDLAPRRLKVARPIQALGLEFGNCGPSLDWYCETVDTGGAYLEEANYVGVAVDRLGLPTVAYYERNTYPYPSISNLKVAYQQPFTIYLPLILRAS
jgi:hypothetical protein